METASLFIKKVSVVLSGTMSHETASDARKALHAKGRGKGIIKGKSSKAVGMC